MPLSVKSKYASKQKRKAEHIKEAYRDRGAKVSLEFKEMEMATKHVMNESTEVRKRAAEIRRNWSPVEKVRRTGLPPDIPTRLRQFILGEQQPEWSTAVCGRVGSGAV